VLGAREGCPLGILICCFLFLLEMRASCFFWVYIGEVSGFAFSVIIIATFSMLVLVEIQFGSAALESPQGFS
jgi:hypothetical protein